MPLAPPRAPPARQSAGTDWSPAPPRSSKARSVRPDRVSPARAPALLQRDIGRFDRAREAQVGEGVFVAAEDTGVSRAAPPAWQSESSHLRRRALEQPAAAAREQRVAAENDRARRDPPVAGDVARRMAGYIEHRQREPDGRDRDRVALGERAGNARDRFARRPEHRNGPAREQGAVAADVVAVMVRVREWRRARGARARDRR